MRRGMRGACTCAMTSRSPTLSNSATTTLAMIPGGLRYRFVAAQVEFESKVLKHFIIL